MLLLASAFSCDSTPRTRERAPDWVSGRKGTADSALNVVRASFAREHDTKNASSLKAIGQDKDILLKKTQSLPPSQTL